MGDGHVVLCARQLSAATDQRRTLSRRRLARRGSAAAVVVPLASVRHQLLRLLFLLAQGAQPRDLKRSRARALNHPSQHDRADGLHRKVTHKRRFTAPARFETYIALRHWLLHVAIDFARFWAAPVAQGSTATDFEHTHIHKKHISKNI